MISHIGNPSIALGVMVCALVACIAMYVFICIQQVKIAELTKRLSIRNSELETAEEGKKTFAHLAGSNVAPKSPVLAPRAQKTDQLSLPFGE